MLVLVFCLNESSFFVKATFRNRLVLLTKLGRIHPNCILFFPAVWPFAVSTSVSLTYLVTKYFLSTPQVISNYLLSSSLNGTSRYPPWITSFSTEMI